MNYDAFFLNHVRQHYTLQAGILSEHLARSNLNTFIQSSSYLQAEHFDIMAESTTFSEENYHQSKLNYFPSDGGSF